MPYIYVGLYSLFVLIGNIAKLVALRELFRVKRARKFINNIFYGRPVLLIDSNLPKQSLRGKIVIADKCSKLSGLSLNEIINSIYTRLLFPFIDIFCFFYTNLSSFKQIAYYITTWLEKGHLLTLPKSTYPRVVIVTEKIPLGAESEAKEAFLWLLGEETIKDLSKLILVINIVALFPNGIMSINARYRRLKERLMNKDGRTLFSVTYFAAFLKYAYRNFLETVNKPFNFIRASRIYNPVASNLVEYLLNFLKYIKSTNKLIEFVVPITASSLFLDSYPPKAYTFKPKTVFNIIYKDSNHVILRSDFINMVENQFSNLIQFQDRWRHIQSSNIYLSYLRRRPQYYLPCGHYICENCIIIFKVRHYFLYREEMLNNISVKVHPLTAGVGVLYINGGGIRDRVGLPIPFQWFIKVAFRVSIGAIFLEIAKRVFKRRKAFNIPFISRAFKLIVLYFTNEVFSIDKSILDYFYATSIGIKIGLPVAIVSSHLLYCIFTNYNGVGIRDED
ncbi:hypothetical protein V2W45_1463679 [Cenococcum geophilum]